MDLPWGTPMQPRKITAMYFPSWVPVIVQLRNTNFDPITRLSLNIDRDKTDSSHYVPWDKSLTVQYGDKVHCLPYTLCPVRAASAMKSFSRRIIVEAKELSEAKRTAQFKIIPASVQFKYLVAYPILFPMYLAQYEKSQGGHFTLVLEGHSNRVYSTELSLHSAKEIAFRRFLRLAPQTPRFATGALERRWSTIPVPYAAQIYRVLGTTSSAEFLLRRGWRIWAQHYFEQRSIEGTAKGHGIDMSNPFVRKYDTVERQSAKRWMDRAGLIYDWDLVTKMSVLKRDADGSSLSSEVTPEQRELAKKILDSYEKLQLTREVWGRPTWLKQEFPNSGGDLLEKKATKGAAKSDSSKGQKQSKVKVKSVGKTEKKKKGKKKV
ncbi:hypothetical protein BV25DRAFT_1818202 [Artomyces pyxidatus]|uniref:Uncharacterized protein n=1 Tax=Artomyces pyxidatus TaxID=48021 RepID=A0ACB8TL79_9AGAM|nr:hypothetical protein BV25DRAFT_1818202 [Artomyces pyxidatus]